MGSWSQLRALRSTRLGGHYPRLTVAETNLLRSEAEAPAGWEVVSNAAATARPADGAAGRWRFATTEKMSTYITALVAGPYHSVRRQHRDIDLGLYCRQSLAQYLDDDEIFAITAAGFDFFENAFGQP